MITDPLTQLFVSIFTGEIRMGQTVSFGASLEGAAVNRYTELPSWILNGDPHIGPILFSVSFWEGNTESDNDRFHRPCVVVTGERDVLISPCGPYNGPPPDTRIEQIEEKTFEQVEIILPYSRFVMSYTTVNAISGNFQFAIEIGGRRRKKANEVEECRPCRQVQSLGREGRDIDSALESTRDWIMCEDNEGSFTFLAATLMTVPNFEVAKNFLHSFPEVDPIFESTWDGIRRALYWDFEAVGPGCMDMTVLVAPSHRDYSFRLLVPAWPHIFEHPGFSVKRLTLKFDYDWGMGIHHKRTVEPEQQALFVPTMRYVCCLIRAVQHAARMHVGSVVARIRKQLVVDLPHWSGEEARKTLRTLLAKPPVIRLLQFGLIRGMTPLGLIAKLFDNDEGKVAIKWLPEELVILHYADVDDEYDYGRLQRALRERIVAYYQEVTITFPNPRMVLPTNWAVGTGAGLRLIKYTFRQPLVCFRMASINEISRSDLELSSDEELEGAFGMIGIPLKGNVAVRLRYHEQTARTLRSMSIQFPRWELWLRRRMGLRTTMPSQSKSNWFFFQIVWDIEASYFLGRLTLQMYERLREAFPRAFEEEQGPITLEGERDLWERAHSYFQGPLIPEALMPRLLARRNPYEISQELLESTDRSDDEEADAWGPERDQAFMESKLKLENGKVESLDYRILILILRRKWSASEGQTA
jgi:hypothetical protein